MRIGLIDVDGHSYPNLPLMKISAFHKTKGDSVKWYDPLFDAVGKPLDVVFMSKVFSFSPDYEYPINSIKIVRGGVRLLYLIARWEGNLRCFERRRTAG